jgi:hypothetical protein
MSYSAALAESYSLTTARVLVNLLMMQADVVSAIVKSKFRQVGSRAVVSLATVFKKQAGSGSTRGFGTLLRALKKQRSKTKGEGGTV